MIFTMQKRILSMITLLMLPMLLSGCVQAILATVAEVGLSVAQERTVGDAVDDAGIMLQIKEAYLQKDVNELTTAVSIEVIEGRVFLTGSVHDPATRINAVRLAWQPKGVKEVINEIQVSKNRGLKQIATDNSISSQISGKMLLNEDIKSINYSIETVNQIVYVMGIAQNMDESELVTDIARTVKGVKSVVSHVRLKDDPLR